MFPDKFDSKSFPIFYHGYTIDINIIFLKLFNDFSNRRLLQNLPHFSYKWDHDEYFRTLITCRLVQDLMPFQRYTWNIIVDRSASQMTWGWYLLCSFVNHKIGTTGISTPTNPGEIFGNSILWLRHPNIFSAQTHLLNMIASSFTRAILDLWVFPLI